MAYRTDIGGGAMIVDEFGGAVGKKSCSATLHTASSPCRSNIDSHSTNHGKGKTEAVALQLLLKTSIQFNSVALLP